MLECNHSPSVNAVYLDTLIPEYSDCGYGRLGLQGRLGYENREVTINGAERFHSISAHAPSAVKFDLARKYARLDAGVAFNDNVPSHAGIAADFSVIVDGVLKHHIRGIAPGGPLRTLSVDVRDASHVTLATRSNRKSYAHTIWVEPVLQYKATGTSDESWRSAQGPVMQSSETNCNATKPPIRLMYLTPKLGIGGAELWIATLCRSFDPAKVIVTSIVSREAIDENIGAAWHVPRTIALHHGDDKLGSASRHADLVLTWGCADLRTLCRNLPPTIPIVDVQHGVGRNKWQRRVADEAVAAGAILTAVTECSRLNFEPSVRSRILVLPNGVDYGRVLPRFGRDAARTRLQLDSNDKLVLFIGRICAIKNIPALVEAISIMHSKWKAVIVGPKGNHFDVVSRRINAKAKGRVSILPSVTFPGDLLAAADVFCLPSHTEAHSLAMNEAWLAGLPVVTCGYPSAQWFNELHGKMNWLVPRRPSASVLAAALEAADSDGREGPIASHAKRIAEKHYTSQAMAARWESMFELILSPSGCS